MTELDRLMEIMETGVDLRRRVFSQTTTILDIANVVEAAMRRGGKVMFCGNGGSASDAMHLAAEWTIRLRATVQRPSWPAISLTLDPCVMSAAGNDFGWSMTFVRPLEGLGRTGDVLIGISTSGRSENVRAAFEKAREMGVATVGLLGGDGGSCLSFCDHAIVVPSIETARVQEVHITLGHAILELVEDRLVQSPD